MNKKLLEAIQTAVDAGNEILKVYSTDIAVKLKSD